MSSLPYEISDNLKHFLLVVSGELLHEILEEHVAVLHKERPDDLVGGLVDRHPVISHRVVIQHLDNIR